MRTHLSLPRDFENDDCTLGTFRRDDGTVECQTLEPPAKHPVPGRRRSPAGDYKVRLRYSPEHGHAVYGYLGIVGFSDVEIHAGNVLPDTKACTLVGEGRGKMQKNGVGPMYDAVLNSRTTLDKFMAARGCAEYKTLTSDDDVRRWILAHAESAEFTVTITDPPPTAAAPALQLVKPEPSGDDDSQPEPLQEAA